MFDRYLTVFMVYCDIGLADRQRTETVRRALQKDTSLPGVLGKRVKAQSNLKKLLEELRRSRDMDRALPESSLVAVAT